MWELNIMISGTDFSKSKVPESILRETLKERPPPPEYFFFYVTASVKQCKCTIFYEMPQRAARRGLATEG